jgi:hypothetical protein
MGIDYRFSIDVDSIEVTLKRVGQPVPIGTEAISFSNLNDIVVDKKRVASLIEETR